MKYMSQMKLKKHQKMKQQNTPPKRIRKQLLKKSKEKLDDVQDGKIVIPEKLIATRTRRTHAEID